MDDRGVVIGFHEKVINPPGNLANGAIYILSAQLLKYLEINLYTAQDFSVEIIGHLLGRIFSYETSESFIDIGMPESYLLANS